MSGLKMKYFVLKPKGADIYAQASREAMLAYAHCIQYENPELMRDLTKWILDEDDTAVCDCRVDQWCINCYESKKPLGSIKQTDC